MKRLLIYLLFLAVFASCKTQNIFQDTKSERKALAAEMDSAFLYNPDYQYRIRKDDKINISVWGQDELSVGSVYGIYNSNEVYGKWLLVDLNGNIEVPKIGTFKVEGQSIIEIKDTLKARFNQWIVNPIIDIKVLNKEITVIGEVRDPAVVQVDKDNNRLLEIISRTGGFAEYANMKYVKILRQEGEHVRMANVDLTKSGGYLQKNIQLHPGDIVVVPSKRYKEFDRRVSIIIPFTTAITAAAIILAAF